MLSQEEFISLAYEKKLQQAIKNKWGKNYDKNAFPEGGKITAHTYHAFCEGNARPSPKVLEVMSFMLVKSKDEEFKPYKTGERPYWERYQKAFAIPSTKLEKAISLFQEAEAELFGTESTQAFESPVVEEEKFIDRSLIGTYYMLIPNRREYKLGDTEPLLRVMMKIEEVEGELFMEYGYYDSGLFRGKLEWPTSGDFFSCTLINQKRPREVASLYAIQYDGKPVGSVFFCSVQAISKDNTIVEYLELCYKVSEKIEDYESSAEKITFEDLGKGDKLSKESKISYDLIYILRAAFREAPSNIKNLSELNSRLGWFAEDQRIERKKMANYPSETEHNFIQKYLADGNSKWYYTYALDEKKGVFKRGQLRFYRNVLGRVVVEVETSSNNGSNKYHSTYLSFDGDALRIVLSRGRERESITISFNYRTNQEGELYFLGFLNSGNNNYKVTLGPNLLVNRKALEGENCDEKKPLQLSYKDIALNETSFDKERERLIFNMLKSNIFKRMELPSYKTFAEMEEDYNKNKKYFDVSNFYSNIKSKIPKIILGKYYWFYPSPHRDTCKDILYRTVEITETIVDVSEELSGKQVSPASERTFSGRAFVIIQSGTILLKVNQEEGNQDPMLLKFWVNSLTSSYKNRTMEAILLAETAIKKHPVALKGILINEALEEEEDVFEISKKYFEKLGDEKRYILTLESNEEKN